MGQQRLWLQPGKHYVGATSDEGRHHKDLREMRQRCAVGEHFAEPDIGDLQPGRNAVVTPGEVRIDHALGFAGAARGEQHVGFVVLSDIDLWSL